jgi:hypothetical protein
VLQVSVVGQEYIILFFQIELVMKNKTKWIWGGICASLLLIVILILLFRTTILMRAGQFMAPQGNYFADVAILEGCTFIGKDIDIVVISGINLLSSGKVKRLILVLNNIVPSDRFIANDKDYPGLVKKEMENLGLKEKDFRIIVTPGHHPTTLTAAKVVSEAISKEDIKSAILLSHGFHTRRSYLVYQYVSLPFQIEIFPSACLETFQPLDRWWSHEQGRRYFAEEFIKLSYYLARGFIPLKLSY